VNVIASFRNAGIVLHLESTGIAVWYVDGYQCHCLLHHFEAPVAAIEMRQHDGDADEIGNIAEPLPPTWLQILDEQEAAQILRKDEQ
jgi:hypothetical protein